VTTIRVFNSSAAVSSAVTNVKGAARVIPADRPTDRDVERLRKALERLDDVLAQTGYQVGNESVPAEMMALMAPTGFGVEGL